MPQSLSYEQEIREGIDILSRKFFVGPGDDERFKKWGEQAIELALDWLKNPEKRKIHADVSLTDLAELFSNTDLPMEGMQIEEVFNDCKTQILDNSVRINNPRYIGHMTTVTPWFSVVVDILISAINQNQVKIETALASSFVERQTIAWMHSLTFKKPEAYYKQVIQERGATLGNMTSGGTLGNLTALAVAREARLPGIRQKGFYRVFAESGYKDVKILASKRVHYSIAKSAAILGLGEEAVVTVDVDENNRMDLAQLQVKIDQFKAEKVLVLAVVGIAGTTETGNLDPLPELADICQREGIWYHVDAAWAGALLLSEELSQKLKGIERADSVVLDGHKLFYLPMNHSMVLFREEGSLDLWRHNAQYIIRKGSVDIGQTSFEGSRRFNALKLWFSLKMLGRKGYHILLKQSLHLTELLRVLLDQDPDFERCSTPEICILTYRFVPQALKRQLEAAQRAGDLEGLNRLNTKLNEINVELQKRQRERGESFISRTTLESVPYPEPIVVLRAVLTNLLTKSEFLAEILEEQRTLGYEILQGRP
ncbi:MAG: pyridoxal-dependent decarboxylase [bacterium]|nr:pyridoxal-dependent decarboxylase [bacterium]